MFSKDSPLLAPESPLRRHLNENSPLLQSLRKLKLHESPRSLPTNTVFRSSTNLRWVILCLTCTVTFANNYNFDIPAALIKTIKSDLSIGDIQYNMLYSAYSLPNTVLPLFGGVLVDQIGVNRSLILFVGMSFVGQCVVALGMFWNSWAVMLLGRFLFGIGGESTSVANNALMVVWFRNKEMALAMGMCTAVGRLGSVVNYHLSPHLAVGGPLSRAGWGGALILFLALLGICFIVIIETRWVKKQKKLGNYTITASVNDSIDFSQLMKFSYLFWLLITSCVLCYACIFPFMNVASDFFQTKWNFSIYQANNYLSIPFSMASVGIPLFGLFVDKYGYRQYFIMLASLGLMFSHGMMGLTQMDPLPFLLILGLCYCMYCGAMWPAAALLVDPDRQVGTGLGLITAVQNIGLTVVPLLVGMIKQYYTDAVYGYDQVQWLFVFFGFSGLIVSIMIMVQDNKTFSRLNSPTMLAQAINELVHTPEFRSVARSTPELRSFR